MTLPLFVVLPLFAAFINTMVGRFLKLFSEVFVNLINFVVLILCIIWIYKINTLNNNIFVYEVGGWKIPYGVALVADPVSVFMLFTVNLVAFLVGIYSVSYIEKYTEKWGFYSLFELMLAGMNGVIISGDIFNIFVFLEIATIASYGLVAFGTQKEELEASFKYMVLGSISTGLILLGIVLIYAYTSTLNLADIASILILSEDKLIIRVIMFIFMIGFVIKAAVVPFHWWLPDAHPSAPAPISAMLSGVLIKTLGVYLIVRLFFNVFPIDEKILKMICYLGTLSMVVGVILALYQWDYKRLLAYHSISQVGYIFLGIGLATPMGVLGGIFHLFNHSLFKSLLFLTSGALEYNFETRNLKEYHNVNKIMPITTFSATIGSFSIAGVPPFNGFWSKLIIIIACLEKRDILLALIAALVSVLTLASFLKVLKYAFYTEQKYNTGPKLLKEVPFFMQFSMLTLAILCFVSGIILYPNIKHIVFDGVIKFITENLYSKFLLK